MSFSSVTQLTKHGWTEGNGLGRNEHGMSEAIKVKLKFDTKGIGHNDADQFTYHWWDHAFNKAASNIDVKVDKEEVKIVKSGDALEISANKPHAKSVKNMLYGRFVRAGTLTGNKLATEKSEDSDESDSEVEDMSSAAKVTDDELFKICGRLTAHKGARHGLKASGKLQRIMEQENQSTSTASTSNEDLESMKRHSVHHISVEDSDTRDIKKAKKKKKKEKRDSIMEIEDSDKPRKTKSKKCKKVKEKDSSISVTKDISHQSPDCVDNTESPLPNDKVKSKSKKKKRSEKEKARKSSKKEVWRM